MRLTQLLHSSGPMHTAVPVRHRNENTLLAHTGCALVLCTFALLTWALPTFGHDTPRIRSGDDRHASPQEAWQISTRNMVNPDPLSDYVALHWHYVVKGEPKKSIQGSVGGWPQCIADGYDSETDTYSRWAKKVGDSWQCYDKGTNTPSDLSSDPPADQDSPADDTTADQDPPDDTSTDQDPPDDDTPADQNPPDDTSTNTPADQNPPQDAPADTPTNPPANQDAPADTPTNQDPPANQDPPTNQNSPANPPANQDPPADAPTNQDPPVNQNSPADAPANQDPPADAPTNQDPPTNQNSPANTPSDDSDGAVDSTKPDPPASTDATLSGLTLSGYNGLTPSGSISIGPFNPTTTSYTASVASNVDYILLNPVVNHAGANYYIPGGGLVSLADGSNVISIKVTAEDGSTFQTYTVTVTRGAGKRLASQPDQPQLYQNTPNPFNSQTIISYFLQQRGLARLEIFALNGQRVAVLSEGQHQAGQHRFHWNGRDDAGRALASGIYLYRLMTTEGVLTRKLTLLQ